MVDPASVRYGDTKRGRRRKRFLTEHYVKSGPEAMVINRRESRGRAHGAVGSLCCMMDSSDTMRLEVELARMSFQLDEMLTATVPEISMTGRTYRDRTASSF